MGMRILRTIRISSRMTNIGMPFRSKSLLLCFVLGNLRRSPLMFEGGGRAGLTGGRFPNTRIRSAVVFLLAAKYSTFTTGGISATVDRYLASLRRKHRLDRVKHNHKIKTERSVLDVIKIISEFLLRILDAYSHTCSKLAPNR